MQGHGETKETQTPRTDADTIHAGMLDANTLVVYADTAKELERENAELRAQETIRNTQIANLQQEITTLQKASSLLERLWVEKQEKWRETLEWRASYNNTRKDLFAALKRAESAERALEEYRQDSARYRWLNNQHNFLIYIEDQEQTRTNVHLRCGQLLDTWIDAALARQEEKHGEV